MGRDKITEFTERGYFWLHGIDIPEGSLGPENGYFPKGTDLSQYSQQYLTKVAEEMNNRPRKSLGFLTPSEVMAQKIKALNGSVAIQK